MTTLKCVLCSVDLGPPKHVLGRKKELCDNCAKENKRKCGRRTDKRRRDERRSVKGIQ